MRANEHNKLTSAFTLLSFLERICTQVERMSRWMGTHLMMEDMEEEGTVIVKNYRELAGNWWDLLPFVIRFSLDLNFPSLFWIHFQYFIYCFVRLFSQQTIIVGLLVTGTGDTAVCQCPASWASLCRGGWEGLSKQINAPVSLWGQWRKKGTLVMSSSLFLDSDQIGPCG